jgi:tetratricopeptide (TPR) repeat protein
MGGTFEPAREQLRLGVEISREAGLLVEAAAGGAMTSVFIEIRAGDLDAAERAARAGMEELDRLGDRAFFATLVLGLAEVLLRQERYEDAESHVHLARETSSPDDVTNLTGADAIEGILLARRGEVAEGERLARAAAELIETTDFYDHRGLVHEYLAQTLALAGKREEALAAAQKALGLYEAKGDEPAAAWARELGDSLAGEP